LYVWISCLLLWSFLPSLIPCLTTCTVFIV
jgi:hypothetical protein